MVNTMNKTASKLAKLEEQRARINAEIQRVRVSEQQQARKDDTRRKVLVGAMALGMAESSQELKSQLMSDLDKYLERPRDRALFGLPALNNTDAPPPARERNTQRRIRE